MTIRDYVSQKLQALGVTEADMMDLAGLLEVSLDDEYTSDVAPSVGKAIAQSIGELMLAPRLSNVNEGGFSLSWDFDNLGKYYLFLCNKWGIKPNDDVLNVAGLSAIMDKTNIW